VEGVGGEADYSRLKPRWEGELLYRLNRANIIPTRRGKGGGGGGVSVDDSGGRMVTPECFAFFFSAPSLPLLLLIPVRLSPL
jgi:hypothetical protein